MSTVKNKRRCASCYTEKDTIHALYCRRDDPALFPDGPQYLDIPVTGPFPPPPSGKEPG